jgi:predicted dienelactone hydrolase
VGGFHVTTTGKVPAGVEWLSRRPDVDPDRIGVVGISMGGMEAIGAAGEIEGSRRSSPKESHAALRETSAGCLRRTALRATWSSASPGFRMR